MPWARLARPGRKAPLKLTNARATVPVAFFSAATLVATRARPDRGSRVDAWASVAMRASHDPSQRRH